jgi:hypothetical protein
MDASTLLLRKGLAALSLAFAVLVAGCGGGGGSDTGSADGSGSPPPAEVPPPTTPPTTPPPPPPPVENAVGVPLKQGDFLEYYARAEESSIVQGSGNSTKQDAAQFRLNLGAPVQRGGVTLFPITISGRTRLLDSIDVAPRWHYLGAAGGKLYGSIDGQSVETVYSPDGALAGFFAQRDPAQPATLTGSTFHGDYLDTSAIAAGNSQSAGGCQVIAGYQICSEDSSSASAYEYFKDGLGPLGFSLSRSSTSSGGGFTTSFTTRYQVELTGTSLAATGIEFGNVPHEISAMNHARQNALATVHDGRIFVFGRKAGGTGTATEPSEIEVYDPATQAWSVIGQTPAAMSDYVATVLGDQSYFVGSGPLYAYDHLGSSWSTPVAASPVQNLSDGKDICTAAGRPRVTRNLKLALWTGAGGEQRIVLAEAEQFLVSGSGTCKDETDFFLNVYTPAAKAWAPLGSFSLPRAFPLDGALISGDQLILSSGSNTAPITVDLVKLEYDTSRSASPNGRSSSAASVERDGLVQYIGGAVRDSSGKYQEYSRQIEAYDFAADSWALGTQLLLGRERSAAVALGEKIYVLGGAVAGGSVTDRVEAYTP